MEFNEKLQELRKQKGYTQEEVAEALFVSRTAVSKWESGRGYPNIESLKLIAKFYGISVDELLCGDELITIAEEESKQIKRFFCDVAFGLLDCSAVMFLFFPLFAQRGENYIQSVSLLALDSVAVWLKFAYFSVIIATSVWGVLTLALQNWKFTTWLNCKIGLSLLLNAIGVFLFIISLQSYAGAFWFFYLVIKGAMLLKRR